MAEQNKTRGRQPSFPDAEQTVPMLVHVPIEIRQHVRDIAERKGERMNQTIARIVESAWKNANRSKKSKSASV